MLTRVQTAGLHGVEAIPVTVEVGLTSGLPTFTVVGLPQSAVREGRERVLSALRHIGVALPPRRITVNLGMDGLLSSRSCPYERRRGGRC
mgnify:CR=1 FL=1